MVHEIRKQFLLEVHQISILFFLPFTSGQWRSS
jgi:hypothetical protein